MSCNKKFRKSSSVGPCEFSSKVESKTLVENLKYFNSLKRKQDECKFDDEDRVIEVKIRKYELDTIYSMRKTFDKEFKDSVLQKCGTCQKYLFGMNLVIAYGCCNYNNSQCKKCFLRHVQTRHLSERLVEDFTLDIDYIQKVENVSCPFCKTRGITIRPCSAVDFNTDKFKLKPTNTDPTKLSNELIDKQHKILEDAHRELVNKKRLIEKKEKDIKFRETLLNWRIEQIKKTEIEATRSVYKVFSKLNN